jgi:N-acetylglucosaminyl-diphospho-decaprenol L-rhamnosyltransferase
LASDHPLLSVIIVSWRVPELLRGCLDSLRAETGDLWPAQLETIVVDNASGDGTVEMLRQDFPWVRTIDNRENVGFGRANTQAYAHCAGRFILLLNPDTLVRERAVSRMLAHMQAHRDIAILGCRLLNGDGTLQRWTGGDFPTLWNTAQHYLFLDKLFRPLGLGRSVYLSRDADADRDVDWVSGACLMIRREAVPDPLFDPSYFLYGEDMDLCHRVKRAGGRIVYSPVASIIHFQGASMQQQHGDILLSSLKGLREFFRRTNGAGRLWLFDLVTAAGFALRWAFYSLAAAGRSAGAARKAKSSRHHLGIALRLIGK